MTYSPYRKYWQSVWTSLNKNPISFPIFIARQTIGTIASLLFIFGCILPGLTLYAIGALACFLPQWHNTKDAKAAWHVVMSPLKKLLFIILIPAVSTSTPLIDSRSELKMRLEGDLEALHTFRRDRHNNIVQSLLTLAVVLTPALLVGLPVFIALCALDVIYRGVFLLYQYRSFEALSNTFFLYQTPRLLLNDLRARIDINLTKPSQSELLLVSDLMQGTNLRTLQKIVRNRAMLLDSDELEMLSIQSQILLLKEYKPLVMVEDLGRDSWKKIIMQCIQCCPKALLLCLELKHKQHEAVPVSQENHLLVYHATYNGLALVFGKENTTRSKLNKVFVHCTGNGHSYLSDDLAPPAAATLNKHYYNHFISPQYLKHPHVFINHHGVGLRCLNASDPHYHFPSDSAAMRKDAQIMADYLVSTYGSDRKFIINAYSLGGVFGTMIARYLTDNGHQAVLINSKSFGRVSDAATNLLTPRILQPALRWLYHGLFCLLGVQMDILEDWDKIPQANKHAYINQPKGTFFEQTHHDTIIGPYGLRRETQAKRHKITKALADQIDKLVAKEYNQTLSTNETNQLCELKALVYFFEQEKVRSTSTSKPLEHHTHDKQCIVESSDSQPLSQRQSIDNFTEQDHNSLQNRLNEYTAHIV